MAIGSLENNYISMIELIKMSQVTNKDLYDAITDLRKEIFQNMETIESKVGLNTDWRNKVMGQATILFIFIGAGINFLMDWARGQLEHN